MQETAAVLSSAGPLPCSLPDCSSRGEEEIRTHIDGGRVKMRAGSHGAVRTLISEG